MIAKLAGAVLMTAGGAWLGMAFSRGMYRSARAVEDMSAALGVMSSEISLLGTPLPDIFERLARDGPEAAREFFLGLCSEAYADGFPAAWCAQIPRLMLPKEAEETLRRLSLTLGRYGADRQCAELGAARLELSGCAQRLRESARVRRRVCPGLGASCAAITAVLLF